MLPGLWSPLGGLQTDQTAKSSTSPLFLVSITYILMIAQPIMLPETTGVAG